MRKTEVTMKRYLAFGGEYEPKPYLRDFLGDFDELLMAKAAVDVCDPEGWPTHVQGCVLDTKLGQVHEFQSEPATTGKLLWRFPRDAQV